MKERKVYGKMKKLVEEMKTKGVYVVSLCGVVAILAVAAIAMSLTGNPIQEQPKVDLNETPNISSKEQDLVQSKPEIIEDLQTEENTYVDDNGEFTTNNLNQEIETEQTVDQSLFEPLPSIDQVFSDQPVEGNSVDVTSEPINVDLTNEVQNSEVESDDDIWKF